MRRHGAHQVVRVEHLRVFVDNCGGRARAHLRGAHPMVGAHSRLWGVRVSASVSCCGGTAVVATHRIVSGNVLLERHGVVGGNHRQAGHWGKGMSRLQLST